MTLDEYQELASRTGNKTIGAESAMLNAALGLCGEAGEAGEHIKKFAFHGKGLDVEAYAKELGDVLWYLAECASVNGLSLNDIAEMNIAKLAKRWPEGFGVAHEESGP